MRAPFAQQRAFMLCNDLTASVCLRFVRVWPGAAALSQTPRGRKKHVHAKKTRLLSAKCFENTFNAHPLCATSAQPPSDSLCLH